MPVFRTAWPLSARQVTALALSLRYGGARARIGSIYRQTWRSLESRGLVRHNPSADTYHPTKLGLHVASELLIDAAR